MTPPIIYQQPLSTHIYSLISLFHPSSLPPPLVKTQRRPHPPWTPFTSCYDNKSNSNSNTLIRHRHRHRHICSNKHNNPFPSTMSIGEDALPGVGVGVASSQFGCHAGSHHHFGDQQQQQEDEDEDGCGDTDKDDEEEEEEEEEEEVIVDRDNGSASERWDVLGLGQAMVDFSGMVDDNFLERLGLEKGTRKVVYHEERGRVLRAMDGCSYKAAAGGSLSNSLVAVARLGGHSIGGPALNVAMAGSVGSDPLGGFFRAKLRRANVNFLSAPIKDGTTGTVIVLTTPDAQRTMLAYQGTSSTVNYDPCLADIISKTKILVVEGYLFELPDTIKTITKACEVAHRSGALVAVTASDVSCIERHYDDFWDIMGNYADFVFANSDEARAFCNFSTNESPVSATRYLSHFIPLVSVTDGPRGSYIGVKGEAVYIPPSSPCVPVDTCGAGDAYASGILYGILRGVSDLKGMGTLAARVAAVVVGQQGTRLRVQDAVELAKSFDFPIESNSSSSSSIRLDHGRGF